MKRMAVIFLAMLAVVLFSGCEPTVNMTARAETSKPGCGAYTTISGELGDQDASTTRVHLQLRKGGKWVDWTKPQPQSSQVKDRAYKLYYEVPDWTTNTLAVRVRSNDSKYASTAVYITPTEYDPGQCSNPVPV